METTYYCLEDAGHACAPRECKDVRCDECPNREKIYPVRFRSGNHSPIELINGAGKVVKTDAVIHPNHYSRWKMEPIEFIAINNLPWWLANVIKYCIRFDAKDGLQDLYKGRSYLDMKIRQIEGHTRFWEKPVAEERKLNLGAQR